ncbi:uncharacterized protein LOC129877194 [Solanum dulcamara]|uniref:uncharacterized protein LOC129877194 n=1 Tax=Solanum dulcamara TaxID=45834 RepID=UPI0024860507|nr:uncharacterized protein LOC129877194 [Solanum dulcamara]
MALVSNQELKEEIKILIDQMPKEEEEEEEEFFEIDLELVNNYFSASHNYNWESYFTASTSSTCTLLANCLLPIADVSCAIPTSTKACDAFISLTPSGGSPFLGF